MAIRVDPFKVNPAALDDARALQASGAAVHKVWEMLREKHGITINERTLHRRLKKDRSTYDPASVSEALYTGSVEVRDKYMNVATLTPDEAASAPAIMYRQCGAEADIVFKQRKKETIPLFLELRRLQLEWFKLASGKGVPTPGGGADDDELSEDAKAKLIAKVKAFKEATEDDQANEATDQDGEEPQDARDAPQDAELATADDK